MIPILATLLAITVQSPHFEGLSWMAAGDKALALGPPRVAAREMVLESSWSPDGRHIAATRFVMPKLELMADPSSIALPNLVISIFDSQSLETLEIGPYASVGQPPSIVWTTDPNLAIVAAQSDSFETSLQKVDLAAHKVTEFYRPKRAGFRGIYASPTQRLVVATYAEPSEDPDEERATFEVLDLRGRLLRTLQAERGERLDFSATWDAEGRRFAAWVWRPNNEGDRTLRYAVFDPMEGQLQYLNTTFETYRPKVEESRISLVRESAKYGTDVYAEGPEKDGRHLIAPAADDVRFAPNGRAVSFTSLGALFVCEIIEMDRSVLEQQRLAAERTKLMSDAKQIALAMMMFTADNDDLLPDADFQESIRTYLKDDSILSRNITFLLGGVAITEIESPAETVMAFIDGPGGRAVAYADGHVKWIPNK